jgi:BON domain
MQRNAYRLLWLLYAAILGCAGDSMAALTYQGGQDPRRPDSYDSSAPEKPPAPDTREPSKTASADRLLVWKVQDAIKTDEKLSDSAHNIQVGVREGKVTLYGVVASLAERNAVVSKVKAIAGAGNLVNKLKITTVPQ